MTNLSPAAQAVLDAANGFNSYSPDDVLNESRWIVAAALRAAAGQVLIRPGIPSSEYSLLMQMIDRDFRAIATELEAQP